MLVKGFAPGPEVLACAAFLALSAGVTAYASLQKVMTLCQGVHLVQSAIILTGHAGLDHVHYAAFIIPQLGATFLDISDEVFYVHAFRIKSETLPGIVQMGERSSLCGKVPGELIHEFLPIEIWSSFGPYVCEPFSG